MRRRLIAQAAAFLLSSQVKMAITVDVKGSMQAVLADIGRVRRDVVDKAVPRTLNKVIAQAKTAASREIRAAGYKLKASTIKGALSTRKASAVQLTAVLTASGKPIPLIQYNARQVADGVSVDVKNGRKIIKHAFIAVMPNGHKGVFVRVGKKHKKVTRNGKTRWTGLPIQELFGPSVPNGLVNKKVQTALNRLMKEKFPVILRQQIKHLSRTR
ncbi:phage tail protein [Massilia sp. W12]|uniref:phage tail protein n=1 Tax=Massilia sp. W12 TaxID=3126507 RepID=UPI0030CEAC3B